MDIPVISCDGCGVCCMHVGCPPFMPWEEEKLPPNLKEEFQQILVTRQVQIKATGDDWVPCAWFDWSTRKCKHYEHRPEVCREFEVGSSECINFRKTGDVDANENIRTK